MATIGIDAGGTSWKAVCMGPDATIISRCVTPTTTPRQTVDGVSSWIAELRSSGHLIDGIGIACFGPVDRNPASDEWGRIGATNKVGWEGANPRALLEAATGLPCVLETDVNGALLAEAQLGAGRGLSDLAYLTVGTGVGGSALVAGNLVGAPFHGEFGHLRPSRSVANIEAFAGSCLFHGDCVEGLASATAIRERWSVEPHELADDHSAWDEVSDALAQLCTSIASLLAPQRIILGGGIMQRDTLVALIRQRFEDRMGGYHFRPETRDAASYLVRPQLGNDAGAIGGILIGRQHVDAFGSGDADA